MTRPFTILFALATAASAQTVMDPDRAAEIREAFERAGSGETFHCSVSSVKPALTFGFRFLTGYQLTFPMNQFSGAGHRVSVHLRVVPEGQPPVYFSTTKMLPEVPDMKVDAAEDGQFAVGEGVYGVDLLLVDDAQRTCKSSWRIQARRTGAEAQLVPVTPPLTVAEADAPEEQSKRASDIAKLTILLNATPLIARRTKLQADDIALLTDSVRSVLRQWPARSVRLIAFNLAQRSIVLDNEAFDVSQMDELTQKLQALELGAINYRTLANGGKPLDLFTGLVQKELGEAKPADAVLIVGPQIGWRADEDFSQFEKRTKPTAIFYLQYIRGPVPIPGAVFYPEPTGSAGVRGPANLGAEGMPIQGMMVATADAAQKLVARLKGETFAIRSPHDLAEAIHRIDPRIARSAPPATAGEPEAAKITAPVLPPTVKPVDEPEKASSIDADPIEVLAAVRDRVLEHGQTIPNHTCVETVERSRFAHTGQTLKSCDAVMAGRRQMGASARLRLSTTDRLRLDVALSTEREIYSWAGAHKFDDRDIDEIVPRGAMGTGPFAAFLLSVFLGRPPRFVFEGDTQINGRAVYEYSFDVPLAESHFRFKVMRRDWVITPYSGNIFVDPKTSDLVRLVVRSDELPTETDTCEVDTTLDYGKIQLNGGLFFLPSSTTQRFVGRDGDESENVYTFSACRDFQAESHIDFGEGARERSAASETPPDAPKWPAGVPVLIEVTDPIDSATAAAGDRIHGRFVQPLHDASGRTLVPQGTPVTGRLMRVEVRHPSPQVSIALRWETVTLGGQTVPLALEPNRKVKPGTNVQLGGIAALASLKRRGVEFELPLPGEEHFAVYHFAGKHALVDSGLRTEWVTGKP